MKKLDKNFFMELLFENDYAILNIVLVCNL